MFYHFLGTGSAPPSRSGSRVDLYVPDTNGTLTAPVTPAASPPVSPRRWPRRQQLQHQLQLAVTSHAIAENQGTILESPAALVPIRSSRCAVDRHS